jgi:hypothetical protein
MAGSRAKAAPPTTAHLERPPLHGGNEWKRAVLEFKARRFGKGRYFPFVEKKIVRILKKIQDVPGLSADEKYLFARSLAATPDERWRMHENFLRSHDLFTRSARKKYGLK